MTPSPRCIALIKDFEGLSLTAYPDPASGGHPWTVGYGATGPSIRKGTRWTLAQANAALLHDVNDFGVGVTLALNGAPTTQGQFDAMVALAYNVGIGNFRSSTLLRMHKAGDYSDAQKQFGRWTRASGKVMPGLVRRRAMEARMYGGQL